jgi:hypothetical protein
MKRSSRLLLFTVALFFAFVSAYGQNHATTIKVQAMDMGSAFMKNDFNNFVKYMHPNIIDFAGGKEKMKQGMDSVSMAMKTFGVSFKRYWIGSPGQIINYNNQLQAVLPISTTMKTLLGDLVAETSMIVISNDNGKNWWFIDTNVYKADKIKNVLPGLSPQLVIPPQKKPQLIPNKDQ